MKAKELTDLSSVPTSRAREEIRDLQRRLGYVDKSIEDIEGQVKLANKIGELSAKKAQMDKDIQSLGTRISSLQLSQTDRLRAAKARACGQSGFPLGLISDSNFPNGGLNERAALCGDGSCMAAA